MLLLIFLIAILEYSAQYTTVCYMRINVTGNCRKRITAAMNKKG